MELPKMLKPRPIRVETLIGTIYPDLRLQLDGSPEESREAVGEGIARIDSWARQIIGHAIPFAGRLAADSRQQFVEAVIDKGLLDKYDPARGSPKAYFGVVLRRVTQRLVRQQLRTSERVVEEMPESASTDAGPLDNLIYKEMLGVARNAYLTLGGKQKLAVKKIYPFLSDGNVDGISDPETERVDRHRGMRVIRSAVSEYIGK